MPESDLRRGDRILTYAYLGEGGSAVWFKGTFISDFDISRTKWPDGAGCQRTYCKATYLDLGRHVWWAKIRMASNKFGWAEVRDGNFSGNCALTDTAVPSKNR
jgi:hypothetical protein